jgi:hypothetical protein
MCIDALPDPDIRLRIREARAKDINETEIIAIRLKAHKMADAYRVQPLNMVTSNREPRKYSSSDKDDLIISLLKDIKEEMNKLHHNSQNYGKSRDKKIQHYKPRQFKQWHKRGNSHNQQNNHGNHHSQNSTCHGNNYQPQGQVNSQTSNSGGENRQTKGSPTLNH